MQRALTWLLLILIPVLAWAGIDRHVGDKVWSDEFDGLFRKYTKHYFGPHINWRWFKAQGIAESGLNSTARSHVGAVGLMQLMPSTYDEIRRAIPYLADIRDARWNIAAAIYYDRKLYRKWRDKRGLQTQDRLAFAFGSYNAGYGNILRAYKRADRRHDVIKTWSQVAPYAPRETRGYVSRIRRLMRQGE